MLCQFTEENEGDITLSDLPFNFPKNCYSVGRLDKDSEGLLLLTNDNFLKTRFLSPKFKHTKTYFAQVEGLPSDEAIDQLQRGVDIRIKKGKNYRTASAKVERIEEPALPERNPPIRYRANIPTAWLSISLTEGKNRQVRRMCAKVGFPVLRLVRAGMEELTLDNIDPAATTAFDKKTMYKKLRL